MVKSSSQSKKGRKFIIDIGPEIDKIVKKKDAKIKKQKLIIKQLEKRKTLEDPKVKQQKAVILDLQTKLVTFEKELRYYKVRRAGISNKTVENAFKNLREGKSLSRMKPNTKLLIQQAGRWDEARRISVQMKLC